MCWSHEWVVYAFTDNTCVWCCDQCDMLAETKDASVVPDLFMEPKASACGFHSYKFRAATSHSVVWRCTKCKDLREELDGLLPEKQNVGKS